ncbi:hypothetical protein SORBI_3010G219200 [Sorghum bicolor]|uniref:Uncharacterized protein n=1 Tax=Sorghum bicolor TaxID=4558 RepID=A0A194YKN4_SORBI|nr:hypothetical protein SORBI_3010G219200 [Sorghum bicolor]
MCPSPTYITIQKHLALSPCFLHLSLSFSEPSFRLRLHPRPVSCFLSVLLQMCHRRSQPIRFLSLSSLSCALR